MTDALTRECMAMMVEREETDLQLKPGAADLLPALKKQGTGWLWPAAAPGYGIDQPGPHRD